MLPIKNGQAIRYEGQLYLVERQDLLQVTLRKAGHSPVAGYFPIGGTIIVRPWNVRQKGWTSDRPFAGRQGRSKKRSRIRALGRWLNDSIPEDADSQRMWLFAAYMPGIFIWIIAGTWLGFNVGSLLGMLWAASILVIMIRRHRRRHLSQGADG